MRFDHGSQNLALGLEAGRARRLADLCDAASIAGFPHDSEAQHGLRLRRLGRQASLLELREGGPAELRNAACLKHPAGSDLAPHPGAG